VDTVVLRIYVTCFPGLMQSRPGRQQAVPFCSGKFGTIDPATPGTGFADFWIGLMIDDERVVFSILDISQTLKS